MHQAHVLPQSNKYPSEPFVQRLQRAIACSSKRGQIPAADPVSTTHLNHLNPLKRLPPFCTNFRAVIPGLLFAALLVPSIARADDPKPALVKSVLLLSPEIDCPSCEDNLKHTLVTAHGVQSADIDVLTNKITVRYNPASIKVQALIGRIRVYGYTATEVK